MSNQVEILSYKHNGELHRVWQYATIIRETSDMIVVVNDHTNVIDGDGRRWHTKEPAVCYFFKNYWFNIVCMLRGRSIYYYCNLSSPFVQDAEGIKYIDYDLDVKVFPTGDKVILDRDEFEFNQTDYNYSKELINVVENELEYLLKRIEKKEFPFDQKTVLSDFNIYLNLKKQLNRKKKKHTN